MYITVDTSHMVPPLNFKKLNLAIKYQSIINLFKNYFKKSKIELKTYSKSCLLKV